MTDKKDLLRSCLVGCDRYDNPNPWLDSKRKARRDLNSGVGNLN